jgi:hypothetical protein
MKIDICIDENTLKNLIMNHIKSSLGDIPFNIKNLKIEVKSKQNYRSEWETANFRAIYSDPLCKQ